MLQVKKHQKAATLPAADFMSIKQELDFEQGLLAVWEEDGDSSEDGLGQMLGGVGRPLHHRSRSHEWAPSQYGTNPPDLLSPLASKAWVARHSPASYGHSHDI